MDFNKTKEIPPPQKENKNPDQKKPHIPINPLPLNTREHEVINGHTM